VHLLAIRFETLETNIRNLQGLLLGTQVENYGTRHEDSGWFQNQDLSM